MGKLFNVKSAETDCLGVVDDKILIQKCRTDDEDVWQEYDNGEIRHKKSGKCMSTTGPSKMTPITLAKCDGKPIQHWH